MGEGINGKFIVIDGIDGSGKTTQTELLFAKMTKAGLKVKVFDFPRYGQKSAAMVEEYLNGNLGTTEEVGPCRASIFYACDRYAASKEIRELLANGVNIISNRYVSANKGHQASKIEDPTEMELFLDWLNHLEYEIFQIPVPDLTILLRVPSEIGYELVLRKGSREYLKGKRQDIHEIDKKHLKQAEIMYQKMAEGLDTKENWQIIDCVEDDRLRSVEEISEDVLKLLDEEAGLKVSDEDETNN